MRDAGDAKGARMYRFTVVVGTLLGIVALALQVPTAGAAVKGSVSISISPTQLILGQHVVARGSTSTALRRPVILQRRSDPSSAWSAVARSRTSTDGKYRVRDPRSRVGQFRIVLPAFDAGPRTRPRLSSRVVRARVSSELAPGQTMRDGMALRSLNGQYQLVMQADGNLVLYRRADSAALWGSTSNGPDRELVMQHDGNLVIYGPGGAVWASHTTGYPNVRLLVQDDGNLVLYSNGRALWDRYNETLYNKLLPDQVLNRGQSLVSPSGEYQLVMQEDGNLVLYRTGGVAVWDTETNGPDRFAVMQSDGNLVVYQSGGPAWWESATTGKSNAHLTLQDDGNLVIYQGWTPVWDRYTTTNSVAERAASAARATIGHANAADTGDAGYFAAGDWAPGPYGEWSGDCVKLTIAAYIKAGLGRIPSAGTARQMYFDYRDRGLIRSGTPPAGALVFYPDIAQAFGHVAVSLGGGQVATTMGLDGANRSNAQSAVGYFGSSPGWAMPPGA